MGNAGYIKRINVLTIFEMIHKRGPISRKELVELTQYSGATVTNHVKRLLAAGLVSESKEDGSTGGGRKQSLLSVVPNSAYMVAVGLSPQRLSIVLLNLAREITAKKTVQVTTKDYRVILEQIQRELEETLTGAQLTRQQVMGIGVAVPGIIDQKKGIIEYSPSFGWMSLPITEMLSERFGIPVLLENEALASAFGHLEKAPRDTEHLVYVGIDERIGCGMVFRGDQLYGRAGELGHIVVDRDCLECSCGRRGCWETVASEKALLAAVNSALGTELSREDLLALSREKGLPVEPLEKVGCSIGMGLADVANILSPDVLVVGGGILDFRAHIEYALRESFFQNVLPALRNRVTIEFSKLNDSACVQGLAAVVYERFLDRLIAEVLE